MYKLVRHSANKFPLASQLFLMIYTKQLLLTNVLISQKTEIATVSTSGFVSSLHDDFENGWTSVPKDRVVRELSCKPQAEKPLL